MNFSNQHTKTFNNYKITTARTSDFQINKTALTGHRNA